MSFALAGAAAEGSARASDITAEVGYFVLPAHRGRGVAVAGLSMAANYVFAEGLIHLLELFHALGNPGSCAVARRAGFLLEGVLRESYLYADGLRHDEHLHARLATDSDGTT